MADDPIRIAAAAENGLFQGTLLEKYIKHGIYVLPAGTLWTDLDQDVGEIRLAIHDQALGHTYDYDETDTTTLDDGLTCRVDGSGHRYKLEEGASISISSVIALQNTPPVSPSNYDAYIVGDSPTGAWAAHATDVAIYTRRGWVFATPGLGMTVRNQATESNLQFDENGDWIDFSVEIPAAAVTPVKMQFPMGVSVEAQQNAPPAVTIGPHYLVGTAGSGAWAGHDSEVAYSTDGTTWAFLTPYEGAVVFNKATDLFLRWTGSAWTNAAGGILDQQVFTTPGAATWNKPTGVTAASMTLIELWSGGAGGQNGAANLGGRGGGGGCYVFLWVLTSLLASSVSLTIGAGGVANSGTGGQSSFGSLLTAPGAISNAGGVVPSLSLGVNGSPAPASNTTGAGSNGTDARIAGAGGASGGFGNVGGNGGLNLGGGAGGDGGDANNGAGSPGAAPAGGGGGGASTAGAGGVGGRGEIRVTTFA